MQQVHLRGTAPVLILLVLVGSVRPAHSYAPVLTPDLVQAAGAFFSSLPAVADNIPLPSEWAQALPGNRGAVMVVTPFIRLAMGLNADEFIADHKPASTLNPAIVERLNLYFADRLLLYVELTHTSLIPPNPPQVQIVTGSGQALAPRQLVREDKLRSHGDLYATRFFVHFALSDGIRPTDTIRVVLRPPGHPESSLTFQLARMR